MRGLLFGSAACALALTVSAVPAGAVELVTNGGFETGDFSGWTATVDPVWSGVDALAPHSGSYAAYFGNVGGTDTISQSIATVAGQTYTISFWLQGEADVTGAAAPNAFKATFGGADLVSLTDAAAFGYTQFSYDVVATGASSALVFTFSHAAAFWDFDDVSVAAGTPAVPEPASWAMMIGGMALVGGLTRRRRTIVSFG